jgi:hypothetical protein
VRLAGRIPVEPLDEERLTNIERRVVAGAVDAAVRRPDIGAPRRHAGWAFAVVALVAAGAIGWMLHPAPRAPGIAEQAPVRVETAAQRSVLDLGDARIESDPATAFELTRPGGGVVIALARGKVELDVAKRGARPPLIVRAGETSVVVVGTRFTVDYGDGRGEVDVQVREGVVRVVHQQQETRVAAGQAWHTRGGLVAASEPSHAAAPSPEAGAPATASGPPAGASSPPPSPATGDAGAGAPGSVATGEIAIAIGELPAVLHDRKAAVPEAPPQPAAPPRTAPPPRAPPRAPADVPRPRAPAQPSDPIVALRAEVGAQPIEPALDLGERNPASAIAAYYRIAAHRAGDEASRAFYSIAVVTYTRLAQSANALDVLDAYMRRFPGGKEYRAVLWLRIRILCLAKIDDRCRAAAYTYLHEAPDGPAARLAERLTLAE